MSTSAISPLVALHATLTEAEQFVAGFEDDASQEPHVTTLLANLRAQITVTEVAISTEAARNAKAAADLLLRGQKAGGAA